MNGELVGSASDQACQGHDCQAGEDEYEYGLMKCEFRDERKGDEDQQPVHRRLRYH